MKRDYGGISWTNHALQRMRERDIDQGDAWYTWRRPDQSRKGKNSSWVYYKTYGDTRIEVVTKKDEKGKWVILSVWSKRVRVKKENENKGLLSKLFEKIFSKKKDFKN